MRMTAAGRSAEMGGRKTGRRKRAVGTREAVLSCLADGEISDPAGMASTVLAEAVGYPGSSAAFAQLLSGMERAGLIEREIRGKRTYRIAASAGAPAPSAAGSARAASANAVASDAASDVVSALGAPATRGHRDERDQPDEPGAGRGPRGRVASAEHSPAASPDHPAASAGHPPDTGVDLVAAASQLASQDGAFDYDELARRLLVQVVQRLAASPGETTPPGSADPPGPRAWEQAVASLERKLASAASRQRKLTAENVRLREQLRTAQQSLARAQEQASAARVTGQLGAPELELLERLLSAPRDQADRQEEAGAG
jgi:hypothetical protein